MIYVPNTYDSASIEMNFYNIEEFVRLQKRYRKALEEYLDKKVHLRTTDKKILSSGLQIPKVEDQSYNFYHQSEVLKSGYLFVRNNIHIERLSAEELRYLKGNPTIEETFIINTLQRVIFEEGAYTFFGPPMDETEVKCNSVIMEFAYDLAKCKTIDQLLEIEEFIKKIYEELQANFDKE